MSVNPPTIPAEAVCEIMETLSANMKISSDRIAAILEKHGVSGDEEALQTSYRKRIGQRLMASIRDETGKRELFAAGNDYIIINCCNDPQKLRAIQNRLQSSMAGLDESTQKLKNRVQFLDRFSAKKKRRE